MPKTERTECWMEVAGFTFCYKTEVFTKVEYFYSLLIPINLYLTDEIYVYKLESQHVFFKPERKPERPQIQRSPCLGDRLKPQSHFRLLIIIKTLYLTKQDLGLYFV